MMANDADVRLVPDRFDRSEMELSIASALDHKLSQVANSLSQLADVDTIRHRLRTFAVARSPGTDVLDVVRISGGASKQQFAFTLAGGKFDGRYVLRMDTPGALIAVDQAREFEAMAALSDCLSVPSLLWHDPEGAEFGLPSCIMNFCSGVSKPTMGVGGVTGLGTILGSEWRKRLAPQFVDNLVAIHSLDWRAAHLPSFGKPVSDPYQVARWQVNWWSRVWEEDSNAPVTTLALAERWLRANLPACPEPVFLHGDYRTGNFLFDEVSGRITVTLDWELSHIGDFHEDLAWLMQRSLGSDDGDSFYYGGIVTRDEWISWYERRSGRTVNPDTLHFYRVLSAFKSICIALGTSLAVSASGQSHQDVLLTWISAYGHIGHAELCQIMNGED